MIFFGGWMGGVAVEKYNSFVVCMPRVFCLFLSLCMQLYVPVCV